MNILRSAFFGLISCMLTVACSSSDDSSGLSQNLSGVVTSAVSTLNEAVPGSQPSALILPRADIQTEYSSADVNILGGYFTTPQSYVQYILNKATDTDPGDGMGLINRFKQKILSGMCPIMGLHPDANNDGIPDVGSGTFTLPNFSDSTVQANILADCPSADVASLVSASGATIGYTVTDVSALTDSQYTIKSEIDFGNDASVDNVLYFRANGAVIRFAFVEVSSNTIDSATLFEFDGTTLKFDFHGGNQDGHYRMLYNRSTRNISMYAHVKNDNNNKLYMSLVGNKSLSTAAMTMTAVKSSVTVVNNGQACITVSGTTFPWASNFASGGCSTITGSDFSSAPAVVAISEAFEGSLAISLFDHTDKALFSTNAEVLTSAIIQ